jgi:hypothetical protein
MEEEFFCARQSTVCPIRQKFALLISKEHFDGSKSARLRRLSALMARFCGTFGDQRIIGST